MVSIPTRIAFAAMGCLPKYRILDCQMNRMQNIKSKFYLRKNIHFEGFNALFGYKIDRQVANSLQRTNAVVRNAFLR
jgi:hypothetical protein